MAMYELRIRPYKDFEEDFAFIQSDFLPRVGEIIENYRVTYEEDDETLTTYIQKLEVQSVHHHLFEDKSSMPTVYANVIKCERSKSNETNK
jgi:hypothetical protein